MVEEKKEVLPAVANEVTITNIREFVRYPKPGVVETMVHITYKTPSGYVGTVEMLKRDFTEAKLKEVLRMELKPEAKLVGKKLVL